MVATTAAGMCQLSSRAAIDSVLFGRIVARDSSLPVFYKATSSQPSLLPHYTTQRVQARSSRRGCVDCSPHWTCATFVLVRRSWYTRQTLVVIPFPLGANGVRFWYTRQTLVVIPFPLTATGVERARQRYVSSFSASCKRLPPQAFASDSSSSSPCRMCRQDLLGTICSHIILAAVGGEV
jgi:hypothetical protein